jgi:ABC-type multidrug transport system fused ATPase/permease subunit
VTIRQTVKAALGLLDGRDRRLLSVATALQMATSALDLIGVVLLGLVGALAVTVVQSAPPPSLVTSVADGFGLGDLDSQQLVVVFSAAAAILLLVKSGVSSFMTRRIFLFLANRQALVTARLTSQLLNMPLIFIAKRSSQETAYALVSGAGSATVLVLGQVVTIWTEGALLLVLTVALLAVDPLVTLGAVIFFGLVALVIQRALGGWAHRSGRLLADKEIESLNAVQEALGSYRETTVSNRRYYYVERVQKLRWQAAPAVATMQYMALLPKYLFEAALVVGALVLAAYLFTTDDAVVAVGTLTLFLAASSRVMPSLLRLQVASIGLRNAAGSASKTFELAQDLADSQKEGYLGDVHVPSGDVDVLHVGFSPSLSLVDVSLTYPGSSQPAVRSVCVFVPPGESLAIVGPSGAGKSTLIDIVLGVLEPDSGEILVGGLDAPKATRRWPGGIAYVPQQVFIANASVRSNVALGLPSETVNEDLIWAALERSHLSQFVHSLNLGLDAPLGEGGARMSGGQRQRIGLARALLSKPKFLVLDEATSALDAETEQAISQVLTDLEGEVTTVTVAHRLSTVRHADHVVYMDRGRILASGSFDEVRQAVPAFDRQATIMGL